jgi:hypothetical protein
MTISYNSYDYHHVILVSVIASFDTEGHTLPLYVRIGDEALKIDSAWLKPTFDGFLEYRCKVIDQGCLKPLVLTYHARENVWTVPENCGHLFF